MGASAGEAYVHDGAIALAGLELGNVLVAPSRCAGMGWTPTRSITAPSAAAPQLLRVLRGGCATGGGPTRSFISASTARSSGCPAREWALGRMFSDSMLADMPLCYPFIINDPGEGAQAKRRAHAVVIDHLVPPMTTADAYGPLAELTQLVDEYYQVERLDPSNLPTCSSRSGS